VAHPSGLATPVKQALDHKRLHPQRPHHLFTAIYAFQRYNVDPATGPPIVDAADDLGPDYQLETVWSGGSRATVSRSAGLSPSARPDRAARCRNPSRWRA